VVRSPRWTNLLNSGWGREADHRLSASGLDDARGLLRVRGGKTPNEQMFSELPQVTDIARSGFILANVLRTRRSGSECVSAPNRDPTSKKDNILKSNTNIPDGGVPFGADRAPSIPEISVLYQTASGKSVGSQLDAETQLRPDQAVAGLAQYPASAVPGPARAAFPSLIVGSCTAAASPPAGCVN
jgi:hypothetical protein